MSAPLLKFIALILGFALWAALGYLGRVPLDPLIALLQMGLGGLITHMLQADSAPAAPSEPAAPAAQGGFASIRMLAVIAIGMMALAGCTSLMRGYEATAASEIRAANDNVLDVWKAAACAMPVGAVLRSPDVIDAVNKFCGGSQAQLGAMQPITVNVTVPAAPAASSTK